MAVAGGIFNPSDLNPSTTARAASDLSNHLGKQRKLKLKGIFP